MKGKYSLDQRQVTVRSPRDAQTLGIGMVYQQFTLIPNMTVLENLAISKAKLNPIIKWLEEERQLTQFMEKMPFKVSLDQLVSVRSPQAKNKKLKFSNSYSCKTAFSFWTNRRPS